jgi:hypothetical protein
MPVPRAQQAEWLQQLATSPRETVANVAELVRQDLGALSADQVLRVGNKVLNGTAGQSFMLVLLTSADLTQTTELAKQYIEAAHIDAGRAGERPDDLPPASTR